MSEKSHKPRNSHSHWTLTDIRFVEVHYGNRPTKEIAAILGRSVIAIRVVVDDLKLGKKLAEPWTEEEIAVLRAHYAKGAGLAHLQTLLPHRSRAAIAARASQMGITGKKSWSARENRFLKKHYGTLPTKEIATTLGRSVSAVRVAVNALGLGKKQVGPWTEQEMEVLQTHYADGTGLAYVQTLLPQRSRASITVQASKMGITQQRSWHPEENRILQEFYSAIGTQVIEKLPHRSIPAIKHQANQLGLRYQKRKSRQMPFKPWIDEEWRLLENNLALPYDELMPLFPGRTKLALEKAKRRLKGKHR